MPSLEELAKNAVPVQAAGSQQSSTPVYYNKHAAKEVVEVDASSLGEAPEHPPTIFDNMMSKLDKAIERDRKEMWENVVAPAKEALENNMAAQEVFGEGGEDAYFDSDVDDTPNKVTTNISNVMVGNAAVELEEQNDEEEDFLNDNSIYLGADLNQDQTDIFGTYPEEKSLVTTLELKKPTAPEFVPEVAAITTGSVDVMPTGNYRFDDSIIDEAFDDDDTIDSNDDVSEEDMSAMKDVVKSNIKPVNNVIDLKAYKISSKPISAGKAIAAVQNTSLSTAKWVLPASNKSIIMSALLGTEIDMLGNRREGQTDLMRNEEIVKTFYNHVVGEKPDSWKAWAKTVLYDDFDHLYFAEYIACFNNASFAPFECQKDHHSFMQKVSINDMIKYKDDDAKEKINALLQKDPTNNTIECEAHQVSDNVVIAFRKPTIWNVMFEDYYLPEKVRRELSDIVAIFRHIDNIYIVDRENGELRPVNTNIVANDTSKTLKNKFKVYYDIIKSLTSDQLNAITPIIAGLHKDMDLVSYQYPETTCPKCGSIIKSSITAPIDILFIRHRLQTILV